MVALLRAMDSPVKKEVFESTTTSWVTMRDIIDRFGKEGGEALQFFEKMHLVETSWQIDSEFNKEKTYHSYYVSVHINTSASITEISDVLYIAAMNEREYRKLENKLLKIVGDEGTFSGDITKKLDLTPTMLKSLVKRSGKLAYRGHRIERIQEE